LLAATVNSAVDRLQQAVERERGFVDAASHELRTPLTILRAEVDTALSAPRDAGELREALRSAAVEVEHLIRIAEGLLVLARADQGQMPVERRPLVLRDLVDDCLRAFDARAAAAGVTLSVTADDAAVMLDPTRVRQALDNLVENAIRHSPDGGRVSVVARAGEEVTIEVCDDGPGFEPEVLARAFQPFNRGRAEGEGCGLGLALAATMAEAHGGRAAVANRAPGGARVTLGFGAPIAAPTAVPAVR
jgi:signal transduction histidine kinase